MVGQGFKVRPNKILDATTKSLRKGIKVPRARDDLDLDDVELLQFEIDPESL